MMRRMIGCGALLLAVALVGCAKGQGYVTPSFYRQARLSRVAVVDIRGDVGSKLARDQIATFFEMELSRRGYGIIERARVNELLGEQEFQSSEYASSEGAARTGRILNVDALVTADVHVNERVYMTAKMISVEEGSILWFGEGSGTTGRTMATVGGAAAGAGLGVLAGGDTEARVGLGIAGGVLGGVAGHALSPQEATQVRKIVAKVCADLPPPPN